MMKEFRTESSQASEEVRCPANPLIMLKNDVIVRLNVGGSLHQVRRSTLMNHPSTLLARIFHPDSALALPDVVDGGFFFDRTPGRFPEILDFYRTNRMRCSRGYSIGEMQEELEFWGIDASCSDESDLGLFLAEITDGHIMRFVDEFVGSLVNSRTCSGTVLCDAASEGMSTVELYLDGGGWRCNNGSGSLCHNMPGFTRDLPRLLEKPATEQHLVCALRKAGLFAEFRHAGVRLISALEGVEALEQFVGIAWVCYYHEDENGCVYLRGVRGDRVSWSNFGIEHESVMDCASQTKVLAIDWTHKIQVVRAIHSNNWVELGQT